MAPLSKHIEYERELHAGDIVSVSSAIADVMDKALRTVHEMRND
jgi:acyl-CoA thioesterase FadM